jgi:hypothetical protein
MRRSSRDYKKESTRDPFELDLDDPIDGGPTFVTFYDPNKVETESSFDMARANDAEVMLRKLLSEDDFAAFWSEWRKKPIDETTALIEDVMKHYGADPKRLPR